MSDSGAGSHEHAADGRPEAEALARRAAARDRDAWASIFEANYRSIYSFVRYRLRGADEAEDIASHVFEIAYSRVEHFDYRGVSALALVAKPGVDLDTLRERVRVSAGTGQALSIRKNRELREASLAIFERTFAVTRVLHLLAVGVAFAGILSGLSALALERARELAILRATGMTPREVRKLVTLQTALMGLFAGLFSIPLGIALALILVFVINRRSFGWSLELTLPFGVLAEAMLLSLLAALLAGIWPAWKMSRANPARALGEE